MKERPILFSAPMVRALLAGTKTQTRRPVKTQACILGEEFPGPRGADGFSRAYLMHRECDRKAMLDLSPYGQPGDRLWVREAWRAALAYELTPPRDIPPGTPIAYQADGAGTLPHINVGKLRPGMFMPRWASRITLEITEVRVERLQDISEADAAAEGVTTDPACPAYDAYAALWDEINGAGAWEANPWVWAVSFKRIQEAAHG